MPITSLIDRINDRCPELDRPLWSLINAFPEDHRQDIAASILSNADPATSTRRVLQLHPSLDLADVFTTITTVKAFI